MPYFDYRALLRYAEALFISVAFIAVGYFVNSGDPAFIDSKIDVALFVVTVLTLFFGFAGLISFIIVYSAAFFIFYDSFALYEMLQLLMLGLILYLFHYIWETKIKEEEIRSDYLGRKLDENTNAFYTLKASYDKLEKSYITKPFSLYDSLQKILNISRDDKKSAKEEFLKFIAQQYHVGSSFLIYCKGEDIRERLSYGKKEEFDRNDVLVKEALSKMKTVCIDFENETDTGYLAVVPVMESDGVSLLVVEDISFGFFNRDVILEISVIFTYFIQSVEKKEFMRIFGCGRPYLSEEFAFELCKLQHIKKLYNISSVALSLKSADLKSMQKLLELINREKRSIDPVQTLTVNKTEYVIIVVFPFSNEDAADSFLKRIKERISKNRIGFKNEWSEDFRYRISDISHNKLEKLLE